MSNATGTAAKGAVKCHDARDPSPPAPFSLPSFLDSTRANLQFERDAEVEEERALLDGGASAKSLEAAGLMLRGLRITEVKTGLYGRCLVTLESSRGGGSGSSDSDGAHPLRHSEISARDIVELRDARTGGGGGGGSGSSSARITTGVVYRIRESSITLALDEFLDASIQQSVPYFNILKLGDTVTYERYASALSSLSELTSSSSSTSSSLSAPSRLLRVLYGDERAARSTRSLPWTPFSSDLNESQKQAIQGALDANDVYMIHGPPGTGKTTTVVELIRQLVARGQRVLACAPSNLAVDNLVEKLSIDVSSSNQQLPPSSSSSSLKSNPTSSPNAFSSIRLVRLGHPARVTSAVLDHTLDNLVRTGEGSEVRRGIREDMDTTLKAIVKAQRSNDRSQRNQLRREMRELHKELRRVERMAVRDNLKSMQVVCATLTNCASKTMLEHFGGHHTKRNEQRDASTTSQGFDVIVIDEAAQAMEVACLLAILRANPSASKLILAGDPRQLGPTIKSADASNGGLGRTLFERLMQREDGRENSCMLVEQYRMNEIIMKWSSNEMYGGRLIGAPSVTSRLLCDLPGVRATEDTSNPFMLIDTAGCDMDEDEQQDGSGGGSASGKVGTLAVQMQRSKSNRHECRIIQSHLDALLYAGVQPKQVGIITPYSGQVSLLRELLLDGPSATRYHGLEIGTVDGFQGREKEAILLSLARSNPDREIGFLSDHRRMNVAITRARRHVALILDSQTISVDPFLERMVEYGMEHGLYRSAEEFTATTRVEGGSMHDLNGPAISNDAQPETTVSSDALPEALRTVMGQPKQLSRADKAQRKKERAHLSSTATSATPSSASAASTSSVTAATASPIQPSPQTDAAPHLASDEEWSESRIEDICRDILHKGRSRTSSSTSTSTSTVRDDDPSSISFSFPPTLNSFQRRLVHEVAERIGDGKELEHKSEGSGMQRSIRVSYQHTMASSPSTTATGNVTNSAASPPPSSSSSTTSLSKNQRKKAAKKAATFAANQQALLGSAASNNTPTNVTAEDRAIARQRALDAMEMKAKGHVSSPPAMVAPAPTNDSSFTEQETNVSVSSDDEDELASTSRPSPSPSPPDQQQQRNKNNKKKNNKKKSKLPNGKDDKEEEQEEEEEDLDSILSEFSTTTCHFDGCRTRTTVMGFTCNYCKERYCTLHMNAALHGCGDRHREAQRNQMRQTMAKQSASSSSSSRPLRESDKVALKSKLEKKLNEEKKARSKQPQPSSKRK